MNSIKQFIPYLIALLCAGFACSQDVFCTLIDRLGSLSMELNYGWYTVLLFVLLTVICCYQFKVFYCNVGVLCHNNSVLSFYL